MNFFAIESLSRMKLVILFLLKLLMGAAVWMVYTRHYSSADFQTYFSDSKLLIERLCGTGHKQMLDWNTMFESTLFNNSRTMIIVNAVIRIFSFGNFFVHIVFFCFFSIVGLIALYKTFIKFFPAKNVQLIISVFFIPTILFWSSAVSKEALIIAITGLIMYVSSFGLKPAYSLKEYSMLLILLIFLVFIKIYMVIALLPVLLINNMIARTSNKKMALKYVFVFSLTCISAFLIQWIHPDYNVLKLISDRQSKAISEAKGGLFLANETNFICIDYGKKADALLTQSDGRFRIKEGSNYLSWKLDNMSDTTFVVNARDTALYKLLYVVQPANTVLEMKRLKPDLLDFIKYSPQAVLNVLLQPTLFNIRSWLHLVVAVENMWLMLIFILAIIFFDKSMLRQKEVIVFSLVFALTIFILIGLTTPVTGAMVRYRTIGMLFFIPVVMMFIDEKKIKQRLLKSKN